MWKSILKVAYHLVERFSWSGTAAREQDFKANEDSNWLDNTDITFYIGHGYGGGLTFGEASHDDSTLDYDDATEDWGDTITSGVKEVSVRTFAMGISVVIGVSECCNLTIPLQL